MYTSAGIPGTGLYAVHHFRGSGKLHPEVRSGVGPVLIGVLLALLIVAVLVIAALVLIS